MKHHLIIIAFLSVMLAGFGPSAGAAEPPALPEHLTDAHLQKVLNWTDAERQAASLAAKNLQAEMDAAIKAGSKSFRIPAGDYTDWLAADQGNTGGHRCILSVVGAKDMRIDATGATFWKSATPGTSVVFADCKDCTVQGITADVLQSPFVQGIVSEIIPAGPNIHNIVTDLEKGFFPAELMSKANFGCGRSWIMRKDGSVRANPEGFGPVNEQNPPGKRAWLYYSDFSGGQPMIQVGDRLAQHVMNSCGGVAVNGCEGTKFEDLTVFSSGVMGVVEGGIRSPGGNTYNRMKIVPRPGSIRIGVTAADGFHSMNQKKGPTLTDCEIARTCDDAINVHGFVNVVLKKLPGDQCVLASVLGRDYDVGTELTLNQAPAMKPLGTAKVAKWEPFDFAEGMRLYTEMQKRYKAEFNTTIRDVMAAEFCVVSFDQPVPLDVLDMATSHEYCGRGTRIANLHAHDGCNRGLLFKAPDSVIEQSRFERIDVGGVDLATGINNFLEGGFLSNVRILNNTFENCGDRTFGHGAPLWAGWGSISLSPTVPPHYEEAFLHLNPHLLYRNIEITGNRINNTHGLPIFIGNTKGVTVKDNIITKPFQAPLRKLESLDLTAEGRMEKKYAPPVPPELIPMLRQPFYGIFISASEDVTLSGNRVEGAPEIFKGLIGVGPWTKNVEGQK